VRFLLAGEVGFDEPAKLIFSIGRALVLAGLAVFFHTDQNPLDGAAARGSLISHQLTGQAVEEVRFHESWILFCEKR
jgi:hypothetical protein